MKKNYIAPEADSYLLEECSMVCNTNGSQSENKAVSVKTKAASNASALSNERNMGVSSSSSSAFGSLWE
jgi:hypothetical protein